MNSSSCELKASGDGLDGGWRGLKGEILEKIDDTRVSIVYPGVLSCTGEQVSMSYKRY